jgi:hypothetical protein
MSIIFITNYFIYESQCLIYSEMFLVNNFLNFKKSNRLNLLELFMPKFILVLNK